MRAAHFPSRKTIDGFDFGYQTSVRKQVVLHLASLDFVTAHENVIFLGPPGTGKTHLATALGIKACVAGHRVQFASATTWVMRLGAAQREHRLDAYLRILDRYPLLIVDEVGYLPFDAEAANLFFQLVGARYERGSLIVTSNKPFTAWGEIFGDPVVAAVPREDDPVLQVDGVAVPRGLVDAAPGQVVIEERSYEQGDALELEIRAFLRSIRAGRPAVVSGEDGLRALETALCITELVQASGGTR